MGTIYTGDDGDSELALKETWEARQQLRWIVGRYKLLVYIPGNSSVEVFSEGCIKESEGQTDFRQQTRVPRGKRAQIGIYKYTRDRYNVWSPNLAKVEMNRRQNDISLNTRSKSEQLPI